MTNMFRNAKQVSYDLSKWDVSNIDGKPSDFDLTPIATQVQTLGTVYGVNLPFCFFTTISENKSDEADA